MGGRAAQLGVEASQVAHVALLPERLAGEVGPLSVRTITWEQVRDTFAYVAPPDAPLRVRVNDELTLDAG